MKNIVHNYSEAEIKVREATSNDPWGPSSSLMSEIADLTYNVVAFSEIMSMIWKRLNDHGKNWRHVYKVSTWVWLPWGAQPTAGCGLPSAPSPPLLLGGGGKRVKTVLYVKSLGSRQSSSVSLGPWFLASHLTRVSYWPSVFYKWCVIYEKSDDIFQVSRLLVAPSTMKWCVIYC